MTSMKKAPAPKPAVAVQMLVSASASFISPKKASEIITPAVVPIRNPKVRLPGLETTASKPPRPVPNPAVRLSRKTLAKDDKLITHCNCFCHLGLMRNLVGQNLAHQVADGYNLGVNNRIDIFTSLAMNRDHTGRTQDRQMA